MNYISILEPRWHDKTVLVASWKVGAINQIKINHKNYPEPFYMTAEDIKQNPTTEVKTKNGQTVKMYAIPLEKLSTDLILETL